MTSVNRMSQRGPQVSSRPRVSAIVLNWNGEHLLEACLASLLEQEVKGLEVIVADNGSTDRSEDVARRLGVRWLPLHRNHGFARGNNLAVSESDAEFILFLNNDMRFARDFVSRLLEPLEEDDGLFAADARQRDWNDRLDLHMATFVVRRGLLRGSLPLLDFEQRATSSLTRVVQGCSANLAVRRRMFEELGGFDERLPAGWEDTEICWRASLRGWATSYTPLALCWHDVGSSSTSPIGEVIRLWGTCGGKLVFSTKHLPVEHAIAAWLLEAFAPVREVAAGRTRRAATRARIVARYAEEIPAILAERRRIYSRAGTSPRKQLSRMLALGEPQARRSVAR
jgi:GT2 family glycosyltransferase